MSSATEQLKRAWDSQATNWYEQREFLLESSRPIHDWLVDHLAPAVGQRVLEIAAGPGDTGFLAAPYLANGRLVSTDLSPSMVEAARIHGAEHGIENADYQVLDAQAMDLEDESFDGVICRWGFMLMPEPAHAFRECRRILKPGGRLVFAVFTGPDENPWAFIPARILTETGYLPPPSSEWQPGILALADRTRLGALLDNAGFASTQVEAVNMTWAFRDADDYWAFLVELTALGPVVRSLPDTVCDAVRAKINERLVPFTTGERIALPARCWCGLAIR
jgi:ubiquinone/menaquinone biosynthesis C-methylase UbiE